MAYNAQFDLSANSAFAQRVEMALLKQCVSVGQEAGTVTNHANRLSLAKKLLAAVVPGAVSSLSFSIVKTIVSSVAAIDANYTDAQLDTLLASNWDLLTVLYL